MICKHVTDASIGPMSFTTGIAICPWCEIERLNGLLTPMRHYLMTLYEAGAVDDTAMKFHAYRPLAECLVLWEIIPNEQSTHETEGRR